MKNNFCKENFANRREILRLHLNDMQTSDTAGFRFQRSNNKYHLYFNVISLKILDYAFSDYLKFTNNNQ